MTVVSRLEQSRDVSATARERETLKKMRRNAIAYENDARERRGVHREVYNFFFVSLARVTRDDFNGRRVIILARSVISDISTARGGAFIKIYGKI